MKGLKFILTGILFGIILSKAEVISWFRIQEMFRFQSFHMYGIIGSAVVLGIIGVALIKRFKLNDFSGKPIVFTDKAKNYKSALLGGSIFGLGWAMTGACPGPLYILIGNGLFVFGVAIISAIFGTYLYGRLKDRLPH
jgi:uncharacterized membrane protein YedE/YeeE